MDQTIRTFVCVEIPVSVRDRIEQLQRQLAAMRADVVVATVVRVAQVTPSPSGRTVRNASVSATAASMVTSLMAAA